MLTHFYCTERFSYMMDYYSHVYIFKCSFFLLMLLSLLCLCFVMRI